MARAKSLGASISRARSRGQVRKGPGSTPSVPSWRLACLTLGSRGPRHTMSPGLHLDRLSSLWCQPPLSHGALLRESQASTLCWLVLPPPHLGMASVISSLGCQLLGARIPTGLLSSSARSHQPPISAYTSLLQTPPWAQPADSTPPPRLPAGVYLRAASSALLEHSSTFHLSCSPALQSFGPELAFFCCWLSDN